MATSENESVKVFISHQKADSELASKIAIRLQKIHLIACYLDVVDPNASQAGDQLGDYLRDVMGKCTQLMAVVSASTKGSWWVPWEIGMATEKDYPIATFAGDRTELPEYLKKWPYLRSDEDLDKYAKATKGAALHYRTKKGYLSEALAKRSTSQEFYRTLRASLGQ